MLFVHEYALVSQAAAVRVTVHDLSAILSTDQLKAFEGGANRVFLQLQRELRAGEADLVTGLGKCGFSRDEDSIVVRVKERFVGSQRPNDGLG
jgi:hypothetical protein